MALQWGGIDYVWNGGHVIALSVVFSVTIITWVSIQIWKRTMQLSQSESPVNEVSPRVSLSRESAIT